MPVERLRMRPWLENIINSGKYPGVEWLDEEQKMFRLPWKHASRNGWTMNRDACLFQAWAEHTGKYKAKEKPNPKIWKANFRCALNSLPDMEEVMERRSTKGNNAFKVYRIIDKADGENKKSATKKWKGRYPRRKKTFSRTSSAQKQETMKYRDDAQMPEEGEVLEVENPTTFQFSVPQQFYGHHLVDHDYAVPRYFDFCEGTDQDVCEEFDVPDSPVVKTEPPSPCEEVSLDCSFYEDDFSDSKNLDTHESPNEEDDKVMSDDEVIELIDELSSECDSSNGSLDTVMEDFPDGCMDSLQQGFEATNETANSAPTILDTNFDTLTVPTCTTKSKSTPDFHSILSTSAQEFLQSCMS